MSHNLTVFFTDGTDISFRYPKQDGAETLLVETINRLGHHQHLMLESQNVFYMFPYQNIKYIKVTPGSKILPDTMVLPEGVIRGVHFLDSSLS